MRSSLHHLVHAVVTFVAVVCGGVFLIPLVRAQPEIAHKFVLGLHDWQRITFIFVLCVLYAHVMFKLLSPRLAHLRYCCTHPPTWLAWIVGFIFLCILDTSVGLDPKGYQGDLSEWIGYAGGAAVVVTVYRLLSGWRSTTHNVASVTHEQSDLVIERIADAKWCDIEDWLKTGAPADYDLFHNRPVAKRLANMLLDGTRSIGVVGPFGAGKTSVIEWMVEELRLRKSHSSKILISKHSCWKFESSSSSIHEMLAGAIQAVEEHVDTFHVSSLPESYRQTFSAGGEWIDTISNLVLGKRDPIEQFEQLSELLSDIDAKVVIVVEDLDRITSPHFDIQEVLAFLEQLKEHQRLSFVLSGASKKSQSIDFQKLCDRIELIKPIEPRHSSELILRVCERCLDPIAFPHVKLGDQNRVYVWHHQSGVMVRDLEEVSFPDAVASLLNTPRAIRHALARTFESWKVLKGEIDFNHLLSINVLRFGAPEAFWFLYRRWDRLKSSPPHAPAFGRSRMERIREAVVDDWNETVQGGDWNTNAAIMLLKTVIPTAASWIEEGVGSGTTDNTPQGIGSERYWMRAINDGFDSNDIPDQRVIRETGQWLQAPSVEGPLVSCLTSSHEYCRVWIYLSDWILGNRPDHILELAENVLTRILQKHGASASKDSEGFVVTWDLVGHRMQNRPGNREWLNARITEAAPVSLAMLNGIWLRYGVSFQHRIVQAEEADAVRQHEVASLRTALMNGATLNQVLAAEHPYALSQFVLDPGEHNPQNICDISSWSWLESHLIEGLRQRSATVAVAIASLISVRDFGVRREALEVDRNLLFGLFPTSAEEVIELLSGLADHIEALDQRQLVLAIVQSSRNAIHERNVNRDDAETN